MKIDRLLGIVIYLLNNERVSARTLADRFEVSTRTIQRDIDALAQAGIPIVSAQGSAGGYGIMEGYKLDRQLMNADDYFFIVTALKGLNSAFEHKHVGLALDKMLSMAPQGGEGYEGPSRRHLFIDFGAFRESTHVENHLRMIEDAISGNRVMEFDYTNARNECLRRRAEPIAVVLKWHAWYLLAFCQLRRDYRTFRLARIRNLCITDEPFSVKHPAPGELYRRIEERDGRPAVRLRLLCRPDIRVSLEDYFPKGTVRANPDGTFVMETTVPEDEPFWMGVILSFGDQIEVLEPDSVRRSIVENAGGLSSLYERRSAG